MKILMFEYDLWDVRIMNENLNDVNCHLKLHG